MNSELNLFGQFAKGNKKSKLSNENCVIYTRVSTKEQADNNCSLGTQRKQCEQYAQKQGYCVVGYFGGTYESAKTDERKEFNRMLTFVKKSNEKIGRIIVYSVDRFSRSGANAIYIAEQLKRQGIVVSSVTQPADTTTASGSLQQNIQFIFSEYDNQQRREKCMSGVKEALLRGEWCTAPPLGYDIVRTSGKKQIVVNATGKLIRKAFYWKANDRLTTEEIRRKIADNGVRISSQRMSEIFRNPFYCGLIVHNMLDGHIVEGKHEKMISHELFLRVNGILAENRVAVTTDPENDEIPLKRFLRCEECGKFLRAYKAYKNKKYYYKCNTLGCKCNKNAESLHQEFKNILSDYVLDINEDTKYLIKEQMISSFNQLTEQTELTNKELKVKLVEVNKKLARLEERFILEEINKDMFEKYNAIFLDEKKKIEQELSGVDFKGSNLEEYIDFAITSASKLATVWDLGDYKQKQELQFLIFPDGILYNRKNDRCRTENVDEIFSYFAGVARVLKENKNGSCKGKMQLPSLVARTGIEPVTFGL